MWVLDFKDLTSQPEVEAFFDRFRAHVQLRRIRWGHLTSGTLFAGHPYFGDLQKLWQTLPRAAVGDLLRLLLLHRYGGVWVCVRVCGFHACCCHHHPHVIHHSQIDNDVVVMRDFRPLLIHVGYQFVMRWINNHVCGVVSVALFIVSCIAHVRTACSRTVHRYCMCARGAR